MMCRALVIGLMLTSSASLSAQTATTRLDAVSDVQDIDKKAQTEDVRFKNERDDRLTVPVRLSGAGPYRFIVDTGADRSAVSRELASNLKLPSAGGAELHSVAGVSTVKTAKVRDVAFTRTPERSVDAAVLESSNMGADGIVGVDLLRSQRVQFDFEKQMLSIVPSGRRTFAMSPERSLSRRGARMAVSSSPTRKPTAKH
jgi:predicted aspartyl protease